MSVPPGLPSLGLPQAWTLLPAPTLGAGSNAAVLTQWAHFWGHTDSPATCVIPGHPAFINQPLQGCLPALLCWGCGWGRLVAISVFHVASELAHYEHRCL